MGPGAVGSHLPHHARPHLPRTWPSGPKSTEVLYAARPLGVGRVKARLGTRPPPDPLHQPPTSVCSPLPSFPEPHPDLPFGTFDVGGVIEEPGEVLVELFHRGPHRAEGEAHTVLQAGQRVCKESRAAGSGTRGLAPLLCPSCHSVPCTPRHAPCASSRQQPVCPRASAFLSNCGELSPSRELPTPTNR